jgi:hypothetical protein
MVIKKKVSKKVTDTFLMPSKQICLLKTSVLRPPAAGGRCGGVSQKWCQSPFAASVPEMESGAAKKGD